MAKGETTALPILAALLLAACGGRTPEPAPPPPQFERAAAGEVAHGERLGRVLGCIGCHGDDLTGEDWSEPGYGTLWTANLTRAAPLYSDAELAAAIRSGRRGDGSEMWEMPSHLFTMLSEGDMAALIAYLRSRPPAGALHPRPSFGPLARREIAAGTWTSSAAQVRAEGRTWPPQAPGEHALGRYIVRATCAECHGMDLAGGRPNPEAALRPDLAVVGAYERADFHRLLRTGIAAGNRRLGMMGGVARGRYAHLTGREMDSIYDYLKARAEAAR